MSETGDSTRFWLVRHGQIAANLTAHWHGWTDSPLTDLGRAQVERVGRWFADEALPVTAIYTSPLQRTRHTAEGIGGALGLDVEAEDALREYGIGELEGTHYRALVEDHDFFERIRADRAWAPPGGESLGDVLTRMQDTFRRLADAHRGENVVVVSHGAALALTISEALHGDALGWGDYHVSNCSVSEFWLDPQPGIGRFDETGHLDGLG